MTSRRTFLTGAAGALGLGLSTPIATRADQISGHASDAGNLILEDNAGPSAGLGVDLTVIAMGTLGSYDSGIGTKDVLGLLNLKDGTWRSLPAATVGAHMAMPLKAGGAILIERYSNHIEIRNPDYSSRKVLEHPTMLFSGHGLEVGRSFWLSAEPATLSDFESPRSGAEAEGSLVELDLDTFEFKRTVKSGAIHPHDMVDLGGGMLALTHYGTTVAGQGRVDGASVLNDIVAPMLVIMDPVTGQVEKRIELPKDGVAAHIAQGGDGRLFILPLQYSTYADTDKLHAASPYGIRLRQDEWRNSWFGQPLPVRIVDPETGKWEDISLGAKLQRRGQSVIANAATGKVFATFPYSDTLWHFDPKTGLAGARRAFDFGIKSVRGVCDLPGTSLIAISGELDGIVIIDANNLAVVARYAMPTFYNVHIAAS